MRIVYADSSLPQIGYQTENYRTQVRFDLSGVMEEFPGGMATLIIQRPGEDTQTPATDTNMIGSYLDWLVSAYEIEKRGFLKAQVIYSVEDVIAKTMVYRFRVEESLVNVEPAPVGWENWVNDLLSAASSVHAEIVDAEATLDEKVRQATLDALKAEGYAEGTQDGTPVTEGPYYHHNAQYHETQAETSADNANRDALKSEGYAIGKQNGVPVTNPSPYLNNNAEYYAGRSRVFAESAAGDAWDAYQSKLAAVEAMNTSVDAKDQSVVARDRAETAAVHEPRIGQNGDWYTWDQQTGQYVDSHVYAQGPKGPTGATGPVGATGPAGSVPIDDNAGEGDTTKVWSANKTAILVDALDGDINSLHNYTDSIIEANYKSTQGDNLIDVPDYTTTINGITFVSDKDSGTVTVNGTATDDARLGFGIDIGATGTHHLSGCPSGGSSSTYYLYLEFEGGSSDINDYGSGVDCTLQAGNAGVCIIIIKSGQTVNNLVYKPMAVCTEGLTLKGLNNALNEKQDAPETAGTAGQVLGLDSNLDPVWVNQSGGGGGVDPDTIAPTEASTTATSAHAVGELFFLNGSLLVALSAIAVGDTITTTGNSPNAAVTKISEKLIKDIQINGTTIVDQGVANIPYAGSSNPGVIKTSETYGTKTVSNGTVLSLAPAVLSGIKSGGYSSRPITPENQHQSAFYGLAKASGDSTQSSSNNSVGTYTESAKSSISDMLNAPETVSGSTPSITAKPGVRYICGECATLTIVVPATGDVEVIFESGSTATVLTVTPPSGVTSVNWANGFDPTSLDANTRYDLIITDGEWGLAASWAV